MNGADWDADMMLKRYIYDYMIRKNLNVSSEIFKDEADVIMNHIAIDDSQRGFLSEWWVIFWEMYTARQSRVGVEEDATEDFSLNPSNQEGNNSQAMGNGLSSKEPSFETQRNMNDMMIPSFDSSLISVDNMNNLHPNNSVNESQQMKIKNSSAMNPFSGLKEDWLKQFNFSKSAIHGSTSLPPFPGNGDVLQSARQQPQQVGIGSTSMSMEWPGFHSPKLNTYLRFSKKKSDQSSSLVQKDKQNADEGIGSTSMNMEWQGFQPPRLGNYLHASEQNPHQSSSLLPKDIFQSQAIISLSRPAIENLLKMERRKEPWIVVLYAPWCPFCKTMEVSYVAMAEKLSGSGTKVGKFQADGDQYLFAQQELYLLSFPTVLFFSKFASQPIKYPSQKRDVDSLLAFVRALNC